MIDNKNDYMVIMMMNVTIMMMTLIDLALVPPFCQVTVCQKKTFSFSSSFFDKQTGDCLPTKTLSFLFLNFKRRLSVKKNLYNFCSWIKKVTVCKKKLYHFCSTTTTQFQKGRKNRENMILTMATCRLYSFHSWTLRYDHQKNQGENGCDIGHLKAKTYIFCSSF